jgi:hypothetical protein
MATTVAGMPRTSLARAAPLSQTAMAIGDGWLTLSSSHAAGTRLSY